MHKLLPPRTIEVGRDLQSHNDGTQSKHDVHFHFLGRKRRISPLQKQHKKANRCSRYHITEGFEIVFSVLN